MANSPQHKTPNDLKNVQWLDEVSVIINLSGDITVKSEEMVKKTHQTISDQGATKIILNFEDVQFIDSAGIAILIGLVTEIRKLEQHLAMSNPNPQLKRTFRFIGLNKFANVFDTLAEAIEWSQTIT